MTYSIPNRFLVLRSIGEEVLDIVLAVGVLPYESQHISDKLWPVLPTMAKRNAFSGIKPELVRNNLAWTTMLTPKLNEKDSRTYILFLKTVQNRPMAILSCHVPGQIRQPLVHWF